MRKRNGFTLVEILIVVIILSILAAIVIPQFSGASEEAKLASLASDLQTIRSQIQLYKAQHNHSPASLPGTAPSVSFKDAMTKYTEKDGTLAATQAPGDGVYGPYLLRIPDNPFNDSNDVSLGAEAGDGSTGWWYSTTTGAFKANDNEEHAGL